MSKLRQGLRIKLDCDGPSADPASHHFWLETRRHKLLNPMNQPQSFGLNPNAGFHPARQARRRRQFRDVTKSQTRSQPADVRLGEPGFHVWMADVKTSCSLQAWAVLAQIVPVGS